MKHSTSQTLYTYWNDVRGERIAPRRFEIEPSRIAGILPQTFILERINSDSFRFRLAGTGICEQFGREFRDTNFLEGWSAADRLTIARNLAVVTQQGAVGVFVVEASSHPRRKAMFEILVLPLTHTREAIDRFLGSISPIETPDWLGTEVFGTKRLISQELIWPNGRPQSVIDKLRRQVPFLPHVRGARIVRSDRRQFRVYDGGLSKPDSDKI